ncbi:MAG: HAD family hydrolase [Myxococcota bacterium]
MTLLERSLWVFDMDGTLTVPAHDFAGFKADHGLPDDKDVLAGTLALPEPRRSEVLQAIRDWEDHIAAMATAQADAVRLLDALRVRGATLAVLTRNTKPGATITLAAAGLDAYFPDEALVLGRDCAAAKPEPDGVQLLMRRAGRGPSDTVMVGDWVFDVMAGKRAGAASVLVERHGPSPAEWAPHCDHVVASLDELLA